MTAVDPALVERLREQGDQPEPLFGTCQVVEREPLDAATAAHPLATPTGVELLTRMLAADRLFRPLTRRARAAIVNPVRAALASAQPGDVLPLPALPDGTHPLTVRALTRRGLAADGRLTPLAVEVVQLAEPLHRKPRPVETVATVGGVL
ncbi:hypothetical protein [Pseudonocardia pini]|uniref:hypothetical protein n=1 Tax=Pseudonocardia pini TaxID=2758030 RepID=UPI0015EFE9D9|nr:hypothetical protein [Pseudonocardia pini]